ncbi:universal stress protein [Scopulibacillus cellulosilyticus]|uniref:Universal stress protein n=1 Tax=Scopulibacillus cellulosilyticus TaxID=2665665 RepID=A0ABW2PV46_9BACL
MYNILVPVDGSEHSYKAVKETLRICEGRESDCNVTLIHTVFSYPEMVIDTDNSFEGKKEGKEIFDSCEEILKNSGLKVEEIIRVGVPAHEICQYAKDHHTDMIVMGSRGRGSIGEIFLGSVSHTVLHRAECPVLIVK